jgi:hypothetical protein
MNASYQPGVVRAEFASGVALDQFFTLDGLLGALIMRTPEYRAASRDRRRFQRYAVDRGRAGALALYAERGWPVPADTHFLPLATWGHGLVHGLWVYASSVGIPNEPWEYDTVYWNRRTDGGELLELVEPTGLPGRVELGKGPYKAYHQPLPLIVTAGVTWHVNGDLAQIEALLAEAPYIGKKRSQGYGHVLRWTITPEDTDRSAWYNDEIQRPIPQSLLEAACVTGDFEIGYYSYRPPYHDARNLALCAMRGRRHAQIPASPTPKTICAAQLAATAFGSS